MGTPDNQDGTREPAENNGVGLGDSAATPIDAVYDELRTLASGYLRQERADHTLQTTALVHEAWLRLSKRDPALWSGRAHYLRAAAVAMRRILINYAEKHRTAKRGGGLRGFSLDESLDQASTQNIDLLALNDALNRLADLDPQKSKVVELRFFGGCTIDETAEALGIGTATVERDWRFARAWLRAELDEA